MEDGMDTAKVMASRAPDGRGWGGDYWIENDGRCVGCRRETKIAIYGDGAVSADPRGVCGGRASYGLVAADHGATGPDVPLCFDCGNERERYEAALSVARRRWAVAS